MHAVPSHREWRSPSQRFYDYGSTQMAEAVAADPTKAARWRTDELDAACTFADLLLVCAQPPMDLAADMAGSSPRLDTVGDDAMDRG